MQDQVDIQVLKVVVSKLDETLDRISESTESIGKLLAVHDQRINGLERDNADTNKEIRDLYDKMEDRTREIINKMEDMEEKIEDKISESKNQSSEQHANLASKVDKLDTRIDELEKWKWYIMGAIVVVGFILKNPEAITKLIQ